MKAAFISENTFSLLDGKGLYLKLWLEETQMFISRRMDEKAVVHMHNGILLSLKKYIWISSNEVDETGAYYTE